MLAIVFGTRPEIIKLAPVIWYLDQKKTKYKLIHTGQHYDPNMYDIFMKQMNIRKPDIRLKCGGLSDARMVSKMIEELEKTFTKHKITSVMVQGDTNTILASSITAKKNSIKLIHIESGTRSFNREMPEEINRIVCDHLSDVLFAPTTHCITQLVKEGIPKERIFYSGNTLVNAFKFAELKAKDICIPHPDQYNLLTMHRQENLVINKIKILLRLIKQLPHITIFPIHPRTKRFLIQNNLFQLFVKEKRILLMDPVGYYEMIYLQKYASLILTDSGGVVEEAALFNKPILVIRDRLEWIDIIKTGHAKVVDLNADTLTKSKLFILKFKKGKMPFPIIDTGKKIYLILKKKKML